MCTIALRHFWFPRPRFPCSYLTLRAESISLKYVLAELSRCFCLCTSGFRLQFFSLSSFISFFFYLTTFSLLFIYFYQLFYLTFCLFIYFYQLRVEWEKSRKVAINLKLSCPSISFGSSFTLHFVMVIFIKQFPPVTRLSSVRLQIPPNLQQVRATPGGVLKGLLCASQRRTWRSYLTSWLSPPPTFGSSLSVSVKGRFTGFWRSVLE